MKVTKAQAIKEIAVQITINFALVLIIILGYLALVGFLVAVSHHYIPVPSYWQILPL
jgi:hypothetical protein